MTARSSALQAETAAGRRFPSYTRCAMDLSRARLTSADLLALPIDGKRHELIDGVHFVNPSPVPRHQLVLGNLYFAIRGFVEERDLGTVFFAPLDVVLSDFDLVEPDLLFISHQRRAILEKRFIRGAPDLAVEVTSPSTRRLDVVLKRRAYRKFGFAEYWIVDPEQETIDVFRGGGEWLEPALRLSRAQGLQMLTSPLFPGLALDLATVFRQLGE
jgi:Uma2 family endonuclease